MTACGPAACSHIAGVEVVVLAITAYDHIEGGRLPSGPLPVPLPMLHNYSTEISVHLTVRGANHALERHIDGWWSREMGGEPMPPASDQKIQAFLDNSRDSYSIGTTSIAA